MSLPPYYDQQIEKGGKITMCTMWMRILSSIAAGCSIESQISTAESADTELFHLVAAGEYVRCWMTLSDGTQINIVNGHNDRNKCFSLHSACANGRPYSLNNVNYTTPAIILNAPYERCTAN